MESDELLRCHSLWSPEIPTPELRCNSESFPVCKTAVAMYQPLRYALFGGPSGIYLRHLTSISVSYVFQIYGIRFHYDRDDVPSQHRELGQYLDDPDDVPVIQFPIKGCEGELISSIEVDLWYPQSDNVAWQYENSILMSFRVG